MRQVIRRPKDPLAKPFLVIWELTQACDLACQHCRANAVTEPHPLTLTRTEGERLLRDITDFGKPYPLVVFTGGDPFKRDDLTHLISHARSLGLHVAVSPSATPLLTRESLAESKAAGAQTISLSLDGSSATTHDAFRGVEGSFERTLSACRWAQELGLRLQINTTLSRFNLDEIVDLAALVHSLRVMTWSLFLLVPTGRGKSLDSLSPQEIEAIMHFLAEAAERIPIKTTEGHHYKRVLAMRQVLEAMGLSPAKALELPPLYFKLRQAWWARVDSEGLETRAAGRRQPMHINSGNGFVFISHLGRVYPSGFLPITAGSVRKQSLVDIYRDSPLFVSLREPSELTGRCGQCEFRELCGGSRSRAFAVSGDPLGEDPSCAYRPGSFPYQEQLQRVLVRQPLRPLDLNQSQSGLRPLVSEQSPGGHKSDE
jgi:radical SAM protein